MVLVIAEQVYMVVMDVVVIKVLKNLGTKNN